jgi:hypothetical protein
MADTSPIDIPCEKLAEWLTERRHLDKDFNLRLRALRKKVDAAIADLPVRQDLQAITRNKENVSYWDCQAVLEILLKVAKAAGTDGKSFFGNYKDEQLHLWDALARAYVKGNLHVAHAARIMNQNVTFEIPALKSSIQRNDKTAKDLARKIADCERNTKDFERQLGKDCEGLKVPVGGVGGDYKASLLRRTAELPGMIEQTHRQLQGEDLGDAIAYYEAFVVFMAGKQEGADASGSAAVGEALVPTLRAIRAADPAAAVGEAGDGDDGGCVELDLGDLGGMGGGEGGAIDWGIDDGGGGGDDEGGGDIDWGGMDLGAAAATDAGDAAAEGEGGEINWDIGPDDDGDGDGGDIDWGIGDDDAGGDGGGDIDWGMGGDDADAAGSAVVVEEEKEGGAAAAVSLELSDTRQSVVRV